MTTRLRIQHGTGGFSRSIEVSLHLMTGHRENSFVDIQEKKEVTGKFNVRPDLRCFRLSPPHSPIQCCAGFSRQPSVLSYLPYAPISYQFPTRTKPAMRRLTSGFIRQEAGKGGSRSGARFSLADGSHWCTNRKNASQRFVQFVCVVFVSSPDGNPGEGSRATS